MTTTPSDCYFANVGRGAFEGRDGTTKCSPITDGDYCHGCKQIICENHSINPSIMGHGHDPLEHYVETSEDDE